MNKSRKPAAVILAIIAVVALILFWTLRKQSDNQGSPVATHPALRGESSPAAPDPTASDNTKSSPLKEKNETLGRLIEMYGEERVALARKLSSDMLGFCEEYISVLDSQMKHPSMQEQKAAGMPSQTATLADLDLGWLGAQKHTEEQQQQARKIYRDFQQRRIESIRTQSEFLRKNPEKIAELYLATDALHQGKIDSNEAKRRISSTGLEPDGIVSPNHLADSLRDWPGDQTYVDEMKKILSDEQIPGFEKEAKALDGRYSRTPALTVLGNRYDLEKISRIMGEAAHSVRRYKVEN